MLPVIAPSVFARGGPISAAALIAAMIGIGALLTNIPSGILATRVGERRAMLIGSVMALGGMALCTPNLGKSGLSLAAYAIGVFVIGAAGSIFNLARQSYLTEVVPPQSRARAMSTLAGTMRVGVFLGPFLGAGAQELWGLEGPYLVGLAVILGAALIVLLTPDLELEAPQGGPGAAVSTLAMLRARRRLFATLGMGVLLLAAIRQTRQSVIPLWAAHLGLSPETSSLIYGLAGAIDAITFYPAGKVMDLYGRRVVAVPSVLILGVAFVLTPLTHSALALMPVAMLMGFGNGIGSGIIMTLGADMSPTVGRPTFLGIWNELYDAGAGGGPLLLSAVTLVATLSVGVVASGGVGFAAALALWIWSPRGLGSRRRGGQATLSRISSGERQPGLYPLRRPSRIRS